MLKNSSDIWITLSSPEAENRFRNLVMTILTINGGIQLELYHILMQISFEYGIYSHDAENIIQQTLSNSNQSTQHNVAYFHDIQLILKELVKSVGNEENNLLDGTNELQHYLRFIEHVVSEKRLDKVAAKTVKYVLSESLPLVLNVLTRKIKTSYPNLKDGTEMIHVPAGDFLYGEKNEKKYLSAFNIMKYPVTVLQYNNFCKAKNYALPIKPPGWKWNDTHPIVNVSFDDATAFAEWADLSLPTELEWEKAARGTHGNIYPWGNDWNASKCCNNYRKLIKQASTSPVGSFSTGISPYGVHDMSGNVWEWCDSLDNNTKMRVMRGGAWDTTKVTDFCTTYRESVNPKNKSSIFGFRCIFRFPEYKK